MTRYWVISPWDYGERQLFQQYWEYDKENSVITIGWNGLGDVTVLNRQDLPAKYDELAPGWHRFGINQLTKFYFDIKPGDCIIARAGQKRIVGIGTVQGHAYYSPTEGSALVGQLDVHAHENFLPVHWGNLTEIVFPRIVFARQTINALSVATFVRLIGS